jgi:hypothetical protein
VETAKSRADTTNADASAASDARDRAEREIAALQATLQREGEVYEAEFEARISVRSMLRHRWQAKLATLLAGYLLYCLPFVLVWPPARDAGCQLTFPN